LIASTIDQTFFTNSGFERFATSPISAFITQGVLHQGQMASMLKELPAIHKILISQGFNLLEQFLQVKVVRTESIMFFNIK